MVFGLLIVLLAVGSVLICGLRRDESSGSPVGVALICYGLLFAVVITQGRILFGYRGCELLSVYDLRPARSRWHLLGLARSSSHAVNAEPVARGLRKRKNLPSGRIIA